MGLQRHIHRSGNIRVKGHPDGPALLSLSALLVGCARLQSIRVAKQEAADIGLIKGGASVQAALDENEAQQCGTAHALEIAAFRGAGRPKGWPKTDASLIDQS